MVFTGREDEAEDGCVVVLFYKKEALPEALVFLGINEFQPYEAYV